MTRLRTATFLVLSCLILCIGGTTAGAREIIPLPLDRAHIDLAPYAERLERAVRDIEIEGVPDPEGDRTVMQVKAQSPGPIFRWLIISLRNTSPIPQDYVIVSDRTRFVGSGVIWPRFADNEILSVRASPGLPPTHQRYAGVDAFAFRVGPNETITYAAEIAGQWPADLQLWQRSAFDMQRQQLSFFHGLLLGIAALVAIYIASLIIVRRQLVFPSAALFSLASVAFLGIEFGYFPTVMSSVAGLEDRVRAIAESSMALGLLACLYTFVELRRRVPIAGYLALALIAAAAGLVVYAWYEPVMATGIARAAIPVIALVGLAVVVHLSRKGAIRAQVSVSAWILATAWSVVACVAALGLVEHELLGSGLAAGLVLVNLMLAFTVTQFAFDAGVISSRFFEDSGRRALALAGSELCVWDWREDQNWLYVGPELERALALPPGRITVGGVKGWLELMHPSDRPAYVTAVDTAIQRGKGTFTQEFRLRRNDGTYRWYQLRARALPGEQGRASRCIGTLADVTTLKRAEERLLYDAVHDNLTGLPNRALFMDRLDRAMARSRSNPSHRLSLILLDIDRFKNVNDGLGHAVGDSLLLAVARRLEELMGPEDTLARVAGDKFGIVMDANEPPRDPRTFAERMQKSLARPIALNPREVFLTASIGIADYDRMSHDPAEVMKDAEIALYEAKRQGKNRIEEFQPTMRDTRSRLVELETDLRRALERNEIEVVYQPIVDLADQSVAGYEALARWRHRRHGVLGPDEFISIAEETGIINDLGEYVMSEAARQLGIWQRAFRPNEPIFVSINLSGRQVMNQGLVDTVKSILGREDLAPGTFMLELTESLVMENPELSAQVFDKLRALGAGLMCDDFGTGHSSLANLQRYAFDVIKLDQTFVHADPDDETAAVILEAIVNLAHDLEMYVVAEDIEHVSHYERLRDIGCDFGQGFHFGQPMSARQVIEALGGRPETMETRRPRSVRSVFNRLSGIRGFDDQRHDDAVDDAVREAAQVRHLPADQPRAEPRQPDRDRADAWTRDVEPLPRPQPQPRPEPYPQRRPQGPDFRRDGGAVAGRDDRVTPEHDAADKPVAPQMYAADMGGHGGPARNGATDAAGTPRDDDPAETAGAAQEAVEPGQPDDVSGADTGTEAPAEVAGSTGESAVQTPVAPAESAAASADDRVAEAPAEPGAEGAAPVAGGDEPATDDVTVQAAAEDAEPTGDDAEETAPEAAETVAGTPAEDGEGDAEPAPDKAEEAAPDAVAAVAGPVAEPVAGVAAGVAAAVAGPAAGPLPGDPPATHAGGNGDAAAHARGGDDANGHDEAPGHDDGDGEDASEDDAEEDTGDADGDDEDTAADDAVDVGRLVALSGAGTSDRRRSRLAKLLRRGRRSPAEGG